MRKEKTGKTKEKERDTHLKAEFQRIAKRDKKTFLSDQCKEIEKKNISCKDGLNKGQKRYGPNRSRSY